MLEWSSAIGWPELNIGYIDMELYNSKSDLNRLYEDKLMENSTNRQFEHGISFGTYDKGFQKSIGGKLENSHKNVKFKKGDRCKMLIDFDKKDITLFYNDEEVEVVFTDIPDQICLAISLYDCAIKCVSYRGGL